MFFQKVLLFVSFMVFACCIKAQTSLEIYNNTNKDVYAAYAYWDSPNASWTSRGWIKIVKYSTTTVDLGSYMGDFFVHGHQSTLLTDKTWGYGYLFCTDPKDKFEMRFSDQINCQKNRKGFTKTLIQKGINKWTFNP